MTLSKNTLTIALAGNANVGKSVIFNQLTGLHQHVGNWPGKTVERAEGTLHFAGVNIDIIDLPGIYSLSTFSIEEIVSRDYIALEKPEVIVNVVDATALERNLFFTLQLMELEPNMIMALNQIDLAEKKGIKINEKILSDRLGISIIPTIAVKNVGLSELMKEALLQRDTENRVLPLRYGDEVEEHIEKIIERILVLETGYPKRWEAIKLLEEDKEISEKLFTLDATLEEFIVKCSQNIQDTHGHETPSVIASERYALASSIAVESSIYIVPDRNIGDTLKEVTSHPVLGYIFMFIVIFGVFASIFTFGDYITSILNSVFEAIKEQYFNILGTNWIISLIWEGLIDGILGGISIALPYIVPFYLVLSILEDSGYLARIAFLMDTLMHKIGLHGKGFIPMMLGFGCSVPACLGCRIMETERERLICAFVSTLIPCAARSIVIMGLVAKYLGFQWALVLYLLDFSLIFLLGRIAFKVTPGEPVGLIMEMPNYRMPSVKVTAQRTWFKIKAFVYEAFPLMIVGNAVIIIAERVGLLEIMQGILSPVTVGWLGLPAATGVVLIFGVLRKELTLLMLGSIMGSYDFSTILSPVQMFVFAFVVMVYIPCIATVAVLVKEFGVKSATIITLSEVLLALFLGGILFRVLEFTGLLLM